ncbi:hypothetical protein MLD38_023658 [Melastoma candidum]|uniref:Uncharacterized protein n=1 Tax=Melastoma candidum TaxID=119954 RepID=A0ACB9NQ33_9MYRT|nr:hypothetical protein MLD38_023658 [Melastoma candidum]
MGCFFRCFSSHNTRRTLSQRKLTFSRDAPRSAEAVVSLPSVKHTAEATGPAVATHSTEDWNIREEKNRQCFGDKDAKTCELSPAPDTVCGDTVKEGREAIDKMGSSPRGRESAKVSTDSPSLEVSSSDGDTSVEEESSDSLFSISIESRDHSYGGMVVEKEVSSPVQAEDPAVRNTESCHCLGKIDGAGDRCLGTVLNPVKNSVLSMPPKTQTTSPLKNHHHEGEENKENAGALPENIVRPCLKPEDCILKPVSSLWDSPQIHDISVDASLSSWLIESDSTPESQRSIAHSFGNSSRRTALA